MLLILTRPGLGTGTYVFHQQMIRFIKDVSWGKNTKKTNLSLFLSACANNEKKV